MPKGINLVTYCTIIISNYNQKVKKNEENKGKKKMKLEVYVSKLPKKCGDCPCCESLFWCNLLDCELVFSKKRLSNCPLKEISELINEKDI